MICILFFISLMPLFTLGHTLWTQIIYAITSYLVGAFIRLYNFSFLKRMHFLGISVSLIIFSLLFIAFIFYLLDFFNILDSFYKSEHHIIGTIPLLSIITSACLVKIASANRGRHSSNLTHYFVDHIILYFAPSVFGVYLIHENVYLKKILWYYISLLMPMPGSFVVGLLLMCWFVLVYFLLLSILVHFLDYFFVRHLQHVCVKYSDKIASFFLAKVHC